MDKEEREQTIARLALSLMSKIPNELLMYLKESGAEAVDLISKPEIVNSMLASRGLLGLHEGDISEGMLKAQHEFQSCLSHSIQILTIWDDGYPYRLLETPDFPRHLFCFGDCDLNEGDFLAIVGTRQCTPYGETFTQRTVMELTPLSDRLVIVSGLAYGIDAAAHKAALQAGTPTVGVLAHGFGTIYPAPHRDLARAIREKGGALLTEYLWGEKPFRKHFLERNRIVAGMSDATLVAESPIKGGAMSTANIAFCLNRTLMALPGRISDEKSSGCNMLISQQKAQLVTAPSDIAHNLGLDKAPDRSVPVIPNLTPELDGEAKLIFETINMEREPIQLDELCQRLQIPVARLTAQLGELEFDGLITRLPGNRFTTY